MFDQKKPSNEQIQDMVMSDFSNEIISLQKAYGISDEMFLAMLMGCTVGHAINCGVNRGMAIAQLSNLYTYHESNLTKT